MFWSSPYFLYVLHDTKHYKIGVSADPYKRCRECQTGNPNYIHVVTQVNCLNSINAHWLERCVHERFARYHVRGEWYRDITAENFTECIQAIIGTLNDKRDAEFRKAAEEVNVRWWPRNSEKATTHSLPMFRKA